jgi:DNA-binding GntR family transcriptional regulator
MGKRDINLTEVRKGIDRYPLPRTISEHIYSVLKKSILNNELKTNQRISEKELADYFHVSKTPVREAVLRLAAEGFIKIDAHRRASVTEISYTKLKDIFQVLGTLDSLAVSLAVDNLTPKDIKKLEDLIVRMQAKCNVDSIEKYLELNVTFHNEIWKAVQNELLKELLYLVRDRMLRYTYARIIALKDPADLKKSMKQHKEILAAIKSKDKEKLKKMISNHRGSLMKSSAYLKEVKKYLKAEEKD